MILEIPFSYLANVRVRGHSALHTRWINDVDVEPVFTNVDSGVVWRLRALGQSLG